MKAFAVAGLAITALVVALGLGDNDPEAQAVTATSCLTRSGESPTLAADQAAIVDRIIALGRDRQIPPRGWAIAIATGMQESGLRNLPGGHLDSIGVMQQRPSAGWGSPEQLRNIDYAINAFYGGPQPPDPPGLLDIPTWQSLDLAEAAQAVQVSAFPDAYARWTALAIDQVRERGQTELDCSQLPGGGAGGRREPDGSWPAEACTVIPDPSTGRGCLTPRTAALLSRLNELGHSRTRCFDEHLQNPGSDHSRGRACDVMFGSPGQKATGAEKTRGDELATWATSTAEQTGVSYVIWYGRIWSVNRPDWRPYNGGGAYDPTDATGGHYDHVHLSVY